jgi:branched-chain amino acid transport system permease protein
VIYGVFMIVIVYFLPNGIVPALSSWWQGRSGRRSGRRSGGQSGAPPKTGEERA